MNDLARIGYERRKLIDDLKWDIYNSRCKLEICGESNVFLRSICNSVSDSLVQEPQAPYIPNDSSKLLVGEYALMDKLQSINQVIERIETEKSFSEVLARKRKQLSFETELRRYDTANSRIATRLKQSGFRIPLGQLTALLLVYYPIFVLSISPLP